MISFYSLINYSDEMDIISFFNVLCFLVRRIPKHNTHIIARNMNAHIGKDENNQLYFLNSQTETVNTKQIFHSRTALHALPLKPQKEKESNGPT